MKRQFGGDVSYRPYLVSLCLVSFAAVVAAQPVPVVLDANVPDVAACHNILTQAILDRVRAAKTDPGKDFEQWRHAHRTMVEASPIVECESKLWRALQHATGIFNVASVPTGTEPFSLAPPDRKLQHLLRSQAASIGSNLDPAGGEPAYQGEVQIAADPNHPQQLVAASNTFYRDSTPQCLSPDGGASATFGTQALFGSTDGGATWSYRCAPWPATLTTGYGTSAYYFGSDPAVAWDAQGRAYAVYMLLAQSWNLGAALVCARSTDAGKTWTSLGTIVNHLSSGTVLDDKEFVAIDTSTAHPGRIYVIWDANNSQRVAHSDDGITWTTTVLPTPSFGLYDIGGDVKVGADGTVYAIWNRLSWSDATGESGEAIVFSKSIDGGVTWSAPVTVATERLFSFGDSSYIPAQSDRGINAFGSLGVDTNPASAYLGRLYVVYSDFPSGVFSGSDTNVYLKTSLDGGATWQSAVKVNDDSGTASQFFPWLSVDPTDGTLNVSWYDTRADSANTKTQRYYARSTDGGASFEPNVLVSDGGASWVNHVSYSDENYGDNRSSNANQYGDYSGIVAINRQVHPFWTDSRQFYPVAGDSRVEDCATATIVNCSPPAAMAAPAVAVAPTCEAAMTLTWSAPAAWGTNATGGTYSVYRSTSSTLPTGATPIATGLTATTYTDSSAAAGTTWYYFVAAKNDCPGTALTPMTTVSAASAPVIGGVSATVSGATAICTGGTATISAVLTGPGPWDLTWSDGFRQSGVTASPATRSVSPAATTTYRVTAISSGACTGVASGTTVVTVNSPPATPAITAGSATTICPGGSVTLTSSAAAGNQWLRDGVAIAGATTSSYDATLAGNYTVAVTVEGCGSATSDPLAVSFLPAPPTPTIGAGGPTEFCVGGSVTLTSSATTGVQWLKDGVPIAGATDATWIASVSGSYSVQVTNADHCVSSSAPVTVIASAPPAAPAITPSGLTTFCEGSSVTLTSSAAPGYQWFRDGVAISGATLQTYAATVSGIYTLEAVAPGCPGAMSAPVAVTVKSNPPMPTISASGATTFCAGGSVTLTSSSADGNQWLRDGVVIGGATTPSIVCTGSGGYSVRVISPTGCVGPASAETAVTVNPAPAAPTISATGATTFCEGGSVQLTTSGSGVQWYRDGVAIPGATDTSYSATLGGAYTATVAWSTNACLSSPSPAVTVTVNPKPVASVTAGGPTTFCSGGSVTLTSSDTYSNQWLLNGVAIPGATQPTYVATGSGNYSVRVFTAASCSNTSAAVTVQVNPLPTAAIQLSGPTAICAGGSVTFTSSSTTGNQWYRDGSPISGATGSTYTATGAGSYVLKVTTNGCTGASSPVAVTTLATPPAKPTVTSLRGTTNLCPGQDTMLQSTPASSYQWFRDGVAIAGQTSQETIASTTGQYSVQIGGASCPVLSDPLQITIWPYPDKPTITATGSGPVCPGGATVTLTSSPAAHYAWAKNGYMIGGANDFEQTLVVSDPGTYQVYTFNEGVCQSPISDPVVITAMPTPAVTAAGPTTFCQGDSVVLSTTAAGTYQWFRDGAPIASENKPSLTATLPGNYTVLAGAGGCSALSAPTAVTVVQKPPIPLISGETTACVKSTLTSTAQTGNQWFLNGTAISGATGSTYDATVTGDYTVQVTLDKTCNPGSMSPPWHVTIHPLPPKPPITASGPTAFCGSSGTVTLSAPPLQSRYDWYRNGNIVTVNGMQDLVVGVPGTYTVVVYYFCPSVPSDPVVVSYDNDPNPAVTAPASFLTGTSATASVAAAAGSTYQWSIANGTISGNSTGTTVTFSTAAAGSVTLTATATHNGCSSTKTATVSALPNTSGMSFTTIAPAVGQSAGGTAFKITGAGFRGGASVTFDGAAATSVVVVDGSTITGLTPRHNPAATDVVVQNADNSGISLLGGFTFQGVRFDPNGDDVVDPADIFYLVNYLFTGGPAPQGWAGKVGSGDANEDGVVDPADIFYTVNYLFTNGPKPLSTAGVTGSITLGDPILRNGRRFLPVIVTTDRRSAAPQAISLKLRGDVIAVRRAGLTENLEAMFETAPPNAWLASFDAAKAPIPSGTSVVVAEVEAEGEIAIDPDGTMLCNQSGTTKATAANGLLRERRQEAE